MFASAFSAFDSNNALKRYYATFDPGEPEEEDVEEFVPETVEDVRDMFETARKAGVIS